MGVTTFLQAVTDWAARSDELCGLALVGSRVHGAATPESDVDLVLLCREPATLIRDAGWTSRFGEVLTRREERYGVMTSIRVVYKDGIEAEFGIADASWASAPLDSGTFRVISDGMRILHDPDGLLKAALDAVETS